MPGLLVCDGSVNVEKLVQLFDLRYSEIDVLLGTGVMLLIYQFQ